MPHFSAEKRQSGVAGRLLRMELVPADDVEGVMRRAIELADDDHDGVLTIVQLQEVAAELGLPASSVAVAVAEKQAGADPGDGFVAKVIGPDRVAVHHRTSMSVEEAQALLVRWLEQGHGLRVLSAGEGVVVGRKRRDMLAPAVRASRSVQGLGGLGKAREVRAVVVPFAEDRTALVLVADIRDRRKSSVAVGGVVAVAGIAAGGAAAVATAPAAAAVAPVAIGAGALIGRIRHKRAVEAITEELEYTSDGIAVGSAPPTLGRSLSAKVKGLRKSRGD